MLSRREIKMTAATRALTLASLVAGGLALLPADVAGQTYRWLDDKGVVHYVQGIDNVPERYRDPRLAPAERETALEALKALRDLESLVMPDMSQLVYQWRLSKLEDVVPKSLRAMRRGRVASTLSRALGHYRLAGQLYARGVAVSKDRVAGSAPGCQRLPRPAAPREPSGSDADRTAALQAVWRCASDQIAAAEALALRPGSGPWAERVKTPAPPRR
jgi:uncharacterized protein DUF4124